MQGEEVPGQGVTQLDGGGVRLQPLPALCHTRVSANKNSLQGFPTILTVLDLCIHHSVALSFFFFFN